MDEKLDPVVEKKKAFEADPDKFVHSDTLICALARSKQGMAIFIRPESRLELVQALGEIQCALMSEIHKIDNIAEAKRKPNIIQPGQGRNRLRGLFKK